MRIIGFPVSTFIYEFVAPGLIIAYMFIIAGRLKLGKLIKKFKEGK